MILLNVLADIMTSFPTRRTSSPGNKKTLHLNVETVKMKDHIPEDVSLKFNIKIDTCGSLSDRKNDKEKVETKESSSNSIDDSDLLDVIKTKPRSKSLPLFRNNQNPKTPPQNGEWSQKLTSPLSLSKIGEKLQNPHSVLEASFLMEEIFEEKLNAKKE